MKRPPDLARGELLERLRQQVSSREGRARSARLAVPPGMESLLEGGLKQGSAYSLTSTGALLLALLAESSRAGHWCGVVGIGEFGAEAAEQAGVELDRLALVPDPGAEWLAVTAALVEALPLVVVRPAGRVRESDAARLASRLRDRGSVLLVHGQWPRAEAWLSLDDERWIGVGEGFGCLACREVTVTARSRRFPVPRSVRLVLPAQDGGMRVASAASAEQPAAWRAVG